MKRILPTLALALLTTTALAQSPPNPPNGWSKGFVPTPAQWNGAFQAKQDWLGANPLLVTGGTLTGELVTAPSTTLGPGLNIPPGTAPTTPSNGDIWTTSGGFFVRINGATQQMTSFPTATRSGDVIYWNGSAWTNFAGNNSGTLCFAENAVGSPSWAACSGGGGGSPGGSNTQVQYNAASSFGGISGVTSDGTAMSFASGDFKLLGSSSGTVTMNAPSSGGGTITLPGGSVTLASLSTPQTFSNTQTFGGTLSVSGTETVTGTLNVSTGVFQIAGNTMTFPGAAATIPQTIATGTLALGTGAISSGACAGAVTATATGAAATDAVDATFNADPTSTTGYQPSTNGMLTIILYPTTNTVNAKVCNNTASPITPGAVTLNWRVTR